MQKTRIDNYSEWQALVSSWIAGVGSDDDNVRTTSNLGELVSGVLSVPVEEQLDFEMVKGMSPNTLAYAKMVADNATVRPPSFPCVVVWKFITLPYAEIDEEDTHLFLEAYIQFVTQEELQ